jgi:hypothetical protein
VTDELVQKADHCIRGKRRFTTSEFSEEFPQTLRTTLCRIFTDILGYHKFCARWVQKQLTDFHKTQRMGSALMFLQRHWEEGGEFLDRIVTGDETWVQFVNTETKEQSKTVDAHALSQQAQEIQTNNVKQKVMATVFWDH